MNSVQEGAFSASSQFDANAQHPRGLARKLTCSAVSIVGTGAILIIIIQVILTLTAVDDWAGGINESMILAEQANLDKLAQTKASFVADNFERVRESVLLLQAFAEQAVLAAPETMTVEAYLTQNSGLTESSSENFDYSVWFIPGLSTDELPEAGTPLEGLLNRSSLMDVAFRGTQRQHELTYLAAVNDSSPTAGTVSEINFQSYPGRDTSGYLEWGSDNECDERFLGDDFDGLSYEPRCRLWYQDAVANGNTGVIITNPYIDANDQTLVISAAAPVFDPSGTLMLGVVGLDIDAGGIESSIEDLRVIGDEGYAYLLAPGGEGQVALHRDLAGDESSTIFDLEPGVDAEEFQGILDTMNDECAGSATYSNGGETWLLSWTHDTASSFQSSASSSSSPSSSGVATSCGADDFIVVVTVSEPALLEASSETKKQIARVVMFTTLVMALLLLVIGCIMGYVARSVAAGITQPVNQLIDVVQSLNKLDFSRQAAGPWMVNSISSPEVEELMEAFKSMSTVVKFANTTLASGDVAAAKAIYVEALLLFTMLENSRGVGIVNNNLGNVHAMQAAELVAQASGASDPSRVKQLVEEAQGCYADADTNYRLAIDDAEMLCAASNQYGGDAFTPPPPPPPTTAFDGVGETKLGYDVEAQGAAPVAEDHMNDDDDTSVAALRRQLADRKYNRALCLAAKGNSAVVMGGRPDPTAIDDARNLLKECIQLTSSPEPLGRGNESDTNVAKNDERRFGYLLQLCALERQQPEVSRAAGEALETAAGVLSPYDSRDPDGGVEATAAAAAAAAAKLLGTPVMIHRQRLLEACASYWVITGYPEAAIDNYIRAIVGTGDVMDPSVVRSSLLGLRGLVSDDIKHIRSFSPDILLALGLPPRVGDDPGSLTSAIDDALTRVAKEETSTVTTVAGKPRNAGEKITVDLCFVMDCTGSMQGWIDQAKTKLLDIITQTKQDVANISLRVAFVGYRDFGDTVQYEGPIDFHKEDDLPKLLAKLKKIKAYGGQDFPEDIAGGLYLAAGLAWRGDIRLCVLIADAPCHGSIYHGHVDNYPRGCPKGRDPRKLLYTLRHEIGADFYFVRITRHTDKMISVFQNAMSSMRAQKNQGGAAKNVQDSSGDKRRDIVVHDLGSDDNRFLEVVVESVKMSVEHQQYKFQTY